MTEIWAFIPSGLICFVHLTELVLNLKKRLIGWPCSVAVRLCMLMLEFQHAGFLASEPQISDVCELIWQAFAFCFTLASTITR